jgi:ParB family transcriptional regulator, chromosome partitioning protein
MTRSVQRIPLDNITWPDQVRDGHDDEDVASMAASLKATGQLYPVLARPMGEGFAGIDGQTRCLAAARLGWKTVLAIVDDMALPEAEALARQIAANLNRKDLKPREKGRGIKRYMDLTGCTASEAAARFGMSIGMVSKHLAVLELPDPIAEQVDAGVIGISAGYELSKLEDAGKLAELASAAANGELTRDEVAQQVASQRKGRKARKRESNGKAAIALSGGRSVTVSAPGLSLESLVQCLEEALTKARQVMSRGGDLDLVVRLCRDEVKAEAAA